LLYLRGAKIDTYNFTGWANKFCQELGDHPDAAAEVGYSHTTLNAGTLKQRSSSGAINPVQDTQSICGGVASCEDIISFTSLLPSGFADIVHLIAHQFQV